MIISRETTSEGILRAEHLLDLSVDAHEDVVFYESGCNFLSEQKDLKELYVIGEEHSLPLGYIAINRSNTFFGAFDGYSNPANLFRKNGGILLSENEIFGLEGINKLTGKGSVVDILLMETFIRSQGLGKILLTDLKKSAELITASVVGSRTQKFYDQNNFVNTGVSLRTGECWTWHNPNFR